jgi:hypothetical protein
VPFVVACPGCRATYRVRAEFVGRTAKCRKCGGRVSVTGNEPFEPDTQVAVAAPGPVPYTTPTIPAVPVLESARSIDRIRWWLRFWPIPAFVLAAAAYVTIIDLGLQNAQESVT